METVLPGAAQPINDPATYKTITDNHRVAFINKDGKKTFYWYLITALLQALLFLPLPVVLIYLYHAPINMLIVTAGLFLLTLVRSSLVEVGTR